jgi:hypothetical protein
MSFLVNGDGIVCMAMVWLIKTDLIFGQKVTAHAMDFVDLFTHIKISTVYAHEVPASSSASISEHEQGNCD